MEIIQVPEPHIHIGLLGDFHLGVMRNQVAFQMILQPKVVLVLFYKSVTDAIDLFAIQITNSNKLHTLNVLSRVCVCVCAVSYTHLDVYKRQI